MPYHWEDKRFSPNLLRPRSQRFLAYKEDGLVQAGLLNMGFLLGVGSWRGLPKSKKDGPGSTELAVDPSCAADIIVSILYQHSPQTLDDFFSATEFCLVHTYDTTDPETAPKDLKTFSIARFGDRVKAGFGRELDKNGRTEIKHTAYVIYELLPHTAGQVLWWRQCQILEESMIAPEREADLEEPRTAVSRGVWEAQAVLMLAPALTQRRWLARPGICKVDINFLRSQAPAVSACAPQMDLFRNVTAEEMIRYSHETSSSEEDDSSSSSGINAAGKLIDQFREVLKAQQFVPDTPPGSEVAAEAEFETVCVDTSPTIETWKVRQNMSVVIPGTESFDDIDALLQAAEKKKNAYRHSPSYDPLNTQKATKSTNSWATMDEILAKTKARSTSASGGDASHIPSAIGTGRQGGGSTESCAVKSPDPSSSS